MADPCSQASTSRKGTTDSNPTKPRRTSPMPCSHDLLRLTLPAIRSPPQSPFLLPAYHVHGIPKLSRDPRVRRVLQHLRSLALLDLPSKFAAELEVVTLVVDRPRSVGLQQHA